MTKERVEANKNLLKANPVRLVFLVAALAVLVALFIVLKREQINQDLVKAFR